MTHRTRNLSRSMNRESSRILRTDPERKKILTLKKIDNEFNKLRKTHTFNKTITILKKRHPELTRSNFFGNI